uniref:Uncharacterized protein n=1 Tax=Ditylenchus dipsaci TaxID=166011 RepID=A0A915CNP3_9BILA
MNTYQNLVQQPNNPLVAVHNHLSQAIQPADRECTSCGQLFDYELAKDIRGCSICNNCQQHAANLSATSSIVLSENQLVAENHIINMHLKNIASSGEMLQLPSSIEQHHHQHSTSAITAVVPPPTSTINVLTTTKSAKVHHKKSSLSKYLNDDKA